MKQITKFETGNYNYVKPIALKNNGKVPAGFVDLYSHLIDMGHMDMDSYATCKIISEGSDYQQIASKHVADHTENITGGMLKVEIKDDTNIYYRKTTDYTVTCDRHYTQQILLYKLGVDCIIKFKAIPKVSRTAFKFENSTLSLNSIGNQTPVSKVNRLSLRSMVKLHDPKDFFFCQYKDDHALIAFSKDWDYEVLRNIIKRYWIINTEVPRKRQTTAV